MATKLTSKILKGDRIVIKDGEVAKYGGNRGPFLVTLVDNIAGSPRLYIGESPSMVWARDAQLAYGMNSPERKEALGL